MCNMDSSQSELLLCIPTYVVDLAQTQDLVKENGQPYNPTK